MALDKPLRAHGLQSERLLMPTKAGFFESPCFSVSSAYHASQGFPGSGEMNATWKPRLSSSTSAWGSWFQ